MNSSRNVRNAAQNTAITTPKSAAEYASSSRAAGTKRAYTSCLKAFSKWCIDEGHSSLPATPQTVAAYLAHLASSGRRVSTIRKAKSAIDAAHRLSGHPAPGKHPMCQEVVQGIARELGVAPRQKRPLVTDDLRELLRHLPDGLKGCRDRALLLLGFAGALRRSEIVALQVDDLSFVDAGLRVRIKKSKRDQEGAGVTLGIPFGSLKSTCPVRAVERWLEAAQLSDGPVFRAVSRHEHLGTAALSAKVVARVVKDYAELAGFDPEHFAGHSLRSGFATAAAMAGVEERDIARQTRHRSISVLRGYVRQATVFRDNAASRVGL